MTLDQQLTDQDGLATCRMKVGGMSCSFCTSTIRTAFGRMDGVHEVGVSLTHEEALVRYDPSIVTEAQLHRTLEDSYAGRIGDRPSAEPGDAST